MNKLQEIDEEIAVTNKNVEILYEMLAAQKKILVKLLQDRCLEKQRIKKIIDLCRTGK